MAGEVTHSDLTLSVKEDPDQGYAFVGVNIEGAFIPVGSYKLGGFREDIAEAQAAAAAEAEAAKSSKSSS